MARKSPEELDVKNIRLFKGDYEKLGTLFPRVGAGPAIRLLVRQLLERAEAAKSPVDLGLNLEDIQLE
jgi:hypothetical protein